MAGVTARVRPTAGSALEEAEGGGDTSMDCAEMGFLDRRLLHPSIPLRFADVIAELERIAVMAGGSSAPSPAEVRTACRRAQSLLWVLRRQFLQDVCLPPTR
ncbi:MAG: hypothetical protein E6G44_01560 [Actinobacteria bacterium]|nr:MAG: hypothetical protein E6G44_01560 [Actinomycetota bacterium]